MAIQSKLGRILDKLVDNGQDLQKQVKSNSDDIKSLSSTTSLLGDKVKEINNATDTTLRTDVDNLRLALSGYTNTGAVSRENF